MAAVSAKVVAGLCAVCLAGCTGYAPGTFQTRDEKVLDEPGLFSGADGRFTVVGSPDPVPDAGVAAAGAGAAAGPTVAVATAPAGAFGTVSEQTERVIQSDGSVVERRIIVQERPVPAP